MKTVKRYFGTDGIRGAVGAYPITPDFMLKLGWAAGRVFAREGAGSKVLIGKDTRVSGYMFESALEAGLTAAGVDINLLGPMPTPAVAYLTRTFRAQAGIVISASHNPFQDNGIKFFSGQGEKLDDELELAIEAQMDLAITTVDSRHIGKASRINDASGRYIEFCKGTVNGGLAIKGMKIVVDCANGATYQVAPNVFAELGARVSVLGNQPDGFNINAGCGSTHPELLAAEVQAQGADLGIAFDGDGDRVIMVDHTGAVVDGDELLFIIASWRRQRGKLEGVVGTLMSNLGMEQALTRQGIPFVRSKVGDRYVMNELQSRGWRLGGESSGHIICLDVTTTGDGLVSALQVLAAMSDEGRSLHELKQGMCKFPQTMINVRLAEGLRYRATPGIEAALKQAELELGDRGRILLRPSGTEPVVRVMVEGEDDGLVTDLARQLSAVVEEELA